MTIGYQRGNFYLFTLNKVNKLKIYINNYITAGKIFNFYFKFLYKKYFLRVVFRPIPLLGKKIFLFIPKIEYLGFKL